MASGDVKLQPLEGPYTHHVYIGHAKEDKKAAFILQRELQNRGVICFPRDNVGDVQISIKQGVTVSQKCLLFMTSNYLKDKWYQIETEAIHDKAKRSSRDTVIILKTSEAQEVPEKFIGCNEILVTPEKLNDEKFLVKLVGDIIREPNVQLAVLPKQNIGFGSALGYFYGYLRLVLPEFKKRLQEGILNNDSELAKKTIKKMLIIMPESCFCPPQILSPGKIEFTGKFVVRTAHRAGNEKRDYKSSLFKLMGLENEEYFFVGELATPLLTMFEAYHYAVCGMTKDQLYAERDAFYFTLKAILNHPDNQNCNDQFRLLYWSDPATEKSNQMKLYDFLLPVLKKELDFERHAESSTSVNTLAISLNQTTLETFTNVDVEGCNPARAFDEVFVYQMKRETRGMCLIINIANFDKEYSHLKTRRGADADTKVLKELFERLHFNVQIHKDITAKTLESLLLTTSCVAHKDCDAFVCCILSHGKLGAIYTSDGKPIEILNIVDFFTEKNCPSLKGKPKMFFIQACQRGESEQERQNDDPQLAYDAHPEPASTVAVGSPSTEIEETTVEPGIEADATKAAVLSILDTENLKHKAVLVPGRPDILMSYSTLPGSISYRDTQYGSLYIQALSECIGKGQWDIERELKQVSSRVREKLEKYEKESSGHEQSNQQQIQLGLTTRNRREEDENNEKFQLPFHLTSGMDKLIYL